MSFPYAMPVGAGEGLEPIVVANNLAADIANWVTPKPAKKIRDNTGSANFYLSGGALIWTRLHFHVVASAAGVGFDINQVFNSVPTTIYSYRSQAAGIFGLSLEMWRPLSAPILDALPNGNAVNGGRVALDVTATAPGTGSWIQAEFLHHHDARYTGRYTATGAAVIFT